MPKDLDWIFEKSLDLTAATMGGRAGAGRAPEFAAQVFKEIYATLKDAAQELPAKSKPGF
ncbi:MAG TPA: hypothetical protein VEO00_04650 [Actinomycetota bacterium]|nr:hypothetical protein [Actinomycetota bacterium]